MTKKAFIVGLAVVMAAYAILISNAKAECVKVDSNIALVVPCSAVGTNSFAFTLDFFANSQDPGNLFWQLDLTSLTSQTTTFACVEVDTTDLAIYVPCAELSGTHYEFNLDPWANPNDAANLFWQMDLTSLKSRSGSQLFINNCGSCHTGNGLGSGGIGDRTGRTTLQIQNAINNVSSMSGLSGLTLPELIAISDALAP